jgi:PAS domain S-box-containing protein
MPTNQNPRELAWLNRLPTTSSVIVTAMGLLVLVGYASRQRILVTVLPGSVPMAANTAALFVLSGIGLWLVSPKQLSPVRRRAGQCLSVLVAAFAAVILSQHITGQSLGVDLLLFADQAREWSGKGIPGRFSPHTGVTFIAAGLAMALLDADARHGHRFARALAGITAVSAVVGLTGRAFGLQYLYGSLHVTAMAINTSVAFVVLSIGLLSCRTDRPLARLFAGESLGSWTMRRLTPVVAAAVLLAGVLFAATRNGTIPTAGFGVTLSTMILVVTLCVVFVRTGKTLNEVDRDQRELLASLRDEHAFNQVMLQSLPDGLIAVAADGTVLQVSRRWCEITGFAERDAVGRRPPYPWWPPAEVAERTTEAAATLRVSEAFELQMRLQRPDGVAVEIVRTTHPVLDEHGGIRMVVGTVRDITEHNRVEAERRRHAEQLTHYFELSADLMCIAGADGYFRRLNPAWRQTFGYTEAELSGRPYADYIHPDDAARTVATMAANATSGNASVSFDNRFRCQDGSYRWLQWKAIHQAGLIYAVARDTTAQRQAADDQARLAGIVESTDDAIISKTLDGTITTWNRAAERIFGYRADQAIGRSIRMIFGDEHDEILERVARGESVTGHENVWRRADGVIVHIGLTASPIRDSGGTVVGAASIARDTTQQHNAEERLRELLQDLARARDEALAAAQIKSQFVAMVSHEIRTPMNGVIGLTALLLNTPLQATQQRYVEAIRASGRTLLSIINDILDFSKIESGKIVLAEADFALDDLVEEVAQVATEAGRGKDLQIQATYPPHLPNRVRGDEGRLRQALLNLLGNAVKFTEHGEVLLHAEPAGAAHPGGITFVVSDTGIGMTPVDLAGIFEPFSQVDAATDREFGGTGLGLSICEQLVQLMGGRLDATSEPGRGSRFTFTIPLAAAAEAPARPRPTSDMMRGRRLLVVDGSDARRRMMAEHCNAWGLTATAAADGRTALAELRDGTARAQPYEFAIVDLHLPDIEGSRLTERITTDPAIDTPILILLTSGSYDEEQVAIAAGAATALPKPIGPSQLYNGLLEILDPQPAAAHPPVADRTAGTHGLVLLAEDNAINQLVAVDTLEMLGYRVDVARNGLEALELAGAKTYQAVLMDCQMPKMDGFAATTELRSREGDGRHTPVIAMTAGALAEDRERCFAAGMDDYLSKPIDPDQLNAALERWITARS